MDGKYVLYKQALYFSLLTASCHPADFRGQTGKSNAENLIWNVRDFLRGRKVRSRLRPEFQIKINLYASVKQQLSEVCKEARGNEVTKRYFGNKAEFRLTCSSIR